MPRGTSYLNNRQQRKWQLDSEHRAWKRTWITENFQSVIPLMRIYNELAHLYLEYCENPQSKLAKELLSRKRKDVRLFLKEELAPFPVALKTGATKQILEDLDRVTDRIEELGLHEQKDLYPEQMRSYLEEIRDVERRLNTSYYEMIEETFK